MTPLRGRLPRAALLGGPAALALLLLVGSWLPGVRPESAEALLRRAAEQFQSRMQQAFREADEVAGLTSSDLEAGRRRAARTLWDSRLEGLAQVDAAGRLVAWWGSLPEPAVWSEGNRFTVLQDGLVVRLVVRTREPVFGACSFLLDGETRGLQFLEWFPLRPPRGLAPRIDWLDARENHDDLHAFFREHPRGLVRGDPPALTAPLYDPEGGLLATVRWVAPSADFARQHRQDRIRGAAAWLLVLACVIWSEALRRRRRPAWLVAGVALLWAGRWILLGTGAVRWLLPDAVAGPALYGSTMGAGLFGSPADFLLTAIAVSWTLLALSGNRPDVRRRVGMAGHAVLVAAGAWTLTAAVRSLATDSVRWLHLLESFDPWPAQACLLGGLGSLLAAQAVLTARALRAVGGTAGADTPAPETRAWTAVAMLLLYAGWAGAAYMAELDRVDLDRLRYEFAPEVLDQRERRTAALRASLAQASESGVLPDLFGAQDPRRRDALAFDAWRRSDLFHLGLKSSMDFYAGGELRAHFAFDLPPLSEPESGAAAEADAGVWLETLESTGERLLHGERPAPPGRVVGHVLDEPQNLAFLAPNAVYLHALGGRAPGDTTSAPEYVLYDVNGTVEFSTLETPPIPPDGFWPPDSPLTLDTGGERYAGLALQEPDGVHLLLVPRRPWIDRLAVMAKLFVLASLLAAAGAFFSTVVQARSWPSPWRRIRGSFRRKLTAALLLASLAPLMGLALLLNAYLERQARADERRAALQVARVVQKVVEDYSASFRSEAEPADSILLDDAVLYWLHRVVEQEIHLYVDGRLEATSKRELFTAGLLTPLIPGDIHARLFQAGYPYWVHTERVGDAVIPVAYARVAWPGPGRAAAVAVPLVLQGAETARTLERIEEVLFLSTVLLTLVVALTASGIARTVARPVRQLALAARRIAMGDYTARARTAARDEVAELVDQFNRMAGALEAQRADLERRRDYMEALLTHATTGVVSLDAGGRVVTSNPAAQTLLAELGVRLGHGTELRSELERHPECQPLAEAMSRAREGVPVEVDLRSGDGRRRFRLVRVPLPDPSGGEPGSLVLIEDVTDLMRSNQLAAWAEMAQAIAHEIKNPLTPIQLSTEHLLRLLQDRGLGDDPKLRACIENIQRQADALREIAGEFSAYAKLPSLRREPVRPDEFLREVVQPYRTSPPPGVEVRLEIQPSPQVSADRRVLSRALVNLVENALEAMAGRGVLTVGVRSLPDGREVAFFVRDTGPGLDPEVQARLFEPYFSTKSSGTGLGLAIVQRAAEAHGGRVEVESRPGEGTEFRLILPAAGA